MTIKLRIKELIAVKERRENRKLSSRTIEKETHLARKTILDYMNNRIQRVDLGVLEVFRDYLGVTSPELLIDEDVPTKK